MAILVPRWLDSSWQVRLQMCLKVCMVIFANRTRAQTRSNVDLIGTGRDEQIANVAWQLSYYFPPEYTWNPQVFEDLRSDAAYVLEMLERDTFQNLGM